VGSPFLDTISDLVPESMACKALDNSKTAIKWLERVDPGVDWAEKPTSSTASLLPLGGRRAVPRAPRLASGRAVVGARDDDKISWHIVFDLASRVFLLVPRKLHFSRNDPPASLPKASSEYKPKGDLFQLLRLNAKDFENVDEGEVLVITSVRARPDVAKVDWSGLPDGTRGEYPVLSVEVKVARMKVYEMAVLQPPAAAAAAGEEKPASAKDLGPEFYLYDTGLRSYVQLSIDQFCFDKLVCLVLMLISIC
jgi:hypothetical protein